MSNSFAPRAVEETEWDRVREFVEFETIIVGPKEINEAVGRSRVQKCRYFSRVIKGDVE